MGLYDRVTYIGKTFDRHTVAGLHAQIKAMGCPYGLSAYQGSYHAGVGQSGGTHDGGGAVDLMPYQWDRKTKAARKVGWAEWKRPALPNVWSDHIHGILIGNKRLSATAKGQVAQYYAHTNGLADHGWDSYWRPKKIRPFNPRKPLVAWRRLNRISRHKGGKARTRSGVLQVELLYIALQGFNFDMRGHKRGHYDATMVAAIKRLQKLKFGRATKHGTVGPKTLSALCLPHKEGRKPKPRKRIRAFTKTRTASADII